MNRHSNATAMLDASERAPAQARRVAIVCDGSARWALARGLAIRDGHEAAADTVLTRVRDAIEMGVRELTLYAFSTENWARPDGEVRELMAMLACRIEAHTPEMHRQGVRLRFIGRRDRTGEALTRAMRKAELMTWGNCGMRVFVALDYGGRDEIAAAARRYRGGGEAAFARLLYAPEMHDPDVVIRTGDERRLSNFLLWQAAFAELVFRSELWPDFGREAFAESLTQYAA